MTPPSAGYPWTVIPSSAGTRYMAALAAASVGHDIGPFTDFLAGLVAAGKDP